MKTLPIKILPLLALTIFVAVFSVGFISNVRAAFNPQINYQGKLTSNTPNGAAVPDASYSFRFNLCPAQELSNTTTQCSSPVWSETWDGGSSPHGPQVQVTSGLFSVMLGTYATSPSLSSVNFNQPLYLEVDVWNGSTYEILTPRKPLGAVPAAFTAGQLEGQTWESPGAIGSTTPATGTFSNLTVSGSGIIQSTIQSSNNNVVLNIQPVSGGLGEIMFKNGPGYVETAAQSLYLQAGSPTTPAISIPYSSDYVGINTTTPTALFSVGSSSPFTVDNSGNVTTTGTGTFGAFQMVTGASNGYVLTANASGTGTWQAAAGGTWTYDSSLYNLYSSGAGNGSITGQNNFFAGYQAGLSAATSSDNIFIGSQAGQANTTAGGNVAIGSGALSTQSYSYSNSAWTSANVAIGYQALHSNHPSAISNGIQNVAIGYQALYSNTGGNGDVASGYAALKLNTTGGNNVAYGFYALESNTTGINNAAFGYNALASNKTAGDNVAMGSSALSGNTYGQKNVAIGSGALSSQSYSNVNTTWDTWNTAVGYNALSNNQPTSNINGYFNTAIGNGALFTNSTGQQNVAVGSNALYYNSTGSYNIAVGRSAGLDLTTGTYNIALGSYVDVPVATGTGQFNMGNLIYATGIYSSNSMSSTPVTGGKVGIGTSNPSALFSVGSGTTSPFTIDGLGNVVATTYNGFTLQTTGSGFTIGNGSVATLTVPASGTAALGTGALSQLAYWSGANTLTGLATGTPGQLLAATSGSPYFTWVSGMTNPMTATGDMIYSSSGSGTPANLSDVATGQVLISGGVGAVPSWSATPTFTGTNITGTAASLTAGYATTATTALTATTAINATYIGTATASSGIFYPLFVSSTSSASQAANLASGLSYNAASSSLTAGAFINSAHNSSVVFLKGDGSVDSNTYMANPMTTQGDIIYENATPAPAKLGIGSTGNILTVASGIPAWTTATYPSTAATGSLLYASGTNTITTLFTGTQYNVLTMGASGPAWGALTLSQGAAITGALGPTHGGTGAGIYGPTANELLVGEGASPFASVATATAGYILMSNGAADPTFKAQTQITSLGTIAAGTWNATAIGTQWGGTGQNFSTVSTGSMLYFNGTGVTTTTAAATSGWVWTSGGANTIPAWQTAPANTALSNLASVAINTSLLPSTTNSLNLGSSSYQWKNLYVGNIIATGSETFGNYHVEPKAGTVYSSVSGNPYHIDLSTGNVFYITLIGNATLVFDNTQTDAPYLLHITTGGNTLTWPTTVLWGTNGQPTLSIAAVDDINLIYNGTYYHGSYALGYSN